MKYLCMPFVESLRTYVGPVAGVNQKASVEEFGTPSGGRVDGGHREKGDIINLIKTTIISCCQ